MKKWCTVLLHHFVYYKTMKKLLILFSILLFAAQIQAQDTLLLDNIKTVNSKIMSLKSDISRTIVKSRKTISQEGKFYFVSPKEFSAQFSTGNYMIVNEKKAKMDIGLFHGTFKLKEGNTMHSLSNIFLYGFQGRIQDLAEGNNYSLSAKTENGYHIVTATSDKKKLKGNGYKKVVFKFQAESFLLNEIILYDNKGNVDTYTISNAIYNVPIDREIFQF